MIMTRLSVFGGHYGLFHSTSMTKHMMWKPGLQFICLCHVLFVQMISFLAKEIPTQICIQKEERNVVCLFVQFVEETIEADEVWRDDEMMVLMIPKKTRRKFLWDDDQSITRFVREIRRRGSEHNTKNSSVVTSSDSSPETLEEYYDEKCYIVCSWIKKTKVVTPPALLFLSWVSSSWFCFGSSSSSPLSLVSSCSSLVLLSYPSSPLLFWAIHVERCPSWYNEVFDSSSFLCSITAFFAMKHESPGFSRQLRPGNVKKLQE